VLSHDCARELTKIITNQQGQIHNLVHSARQELTKMKVQQQKNRKLFFLKVHQQKETRRRNHLLSKKKCLYRSKEDRVCVSIITGPIG